MSVGSQVGQYRVLHQIGEGGMGSVWLAEHAMLGRRAAIKILHAQFSTQKDIVTRFFNEARAATAISDPGIVQIFDYGQHVDGSAYIVMELLEGETLAQRLERFHRLPLGEALRIMRQVASSLGAAHQRGIVHRDLKPENIFIIRDSEVEAGERAKIVDFGIAKLVGDTSVKTQTSAVFGSPMYMSPEQCRGAGAIDHRADIYAVGCVLFTLIAGRPPFVAEGIGDLIAMHLREPAPAPSSVVPGVPPEVDHIVLRCLAKDPAQRFATAVELAQALASVGGGRMSGPAIRPSVSAPAPHVPVSPTTLTAATGMDASPPPAPRSRIVPIVAVTMLAAGIGVAVIATRSDDSAKPPPELPAPAPAAAPVPAPAPPPSPPPPPDPVAQAKPAIRDALAKFVTWSRDHAGAPCPDAAGLGATNDPWGQTIRITCSDQPANQIVGVISSGPDGKPGTDDDIASWQLGHDVTQAVHGARWKTTVATAKKAIAVAVKPAPEKPAPEKPAAEKPAKPLPAKSSKPIVTDENGIPDQR